MFEQFRYETRMRMIREERELLYVIYISHVVCMIQGDSHHVVFLFSPENL